MFIGFDELRDLIKKATPKKLEAFPAIAAKFIKDAQKKAGKNKPVSDFVSSFAFGKISNERYENNGCLLDEVFIEILANQDITDPKSPWTASAVAS